MRNFCVRHLDNIWVLWSGDVYLGTLTDLEGNINARKYIEIIKQ